MKWLILLYCACFLLIAESQLYAQNHKSPEKEFHYIDVQVNGIDSIGYSFLEKYDSFSVDTQLSLWVKFKLIRPKQIKKLHQLYPTASTNLYMSGLLSQGPICIYSTIGYFDGMCTYRTYDTGVIIALLSAIATEKPDSIEWLCNKLVDNIEVSGYDGSGNSDVDVRNRIRKHRQYNDDAILKYAERNKIKLPVEKCMSRINGEPIQNPVTGDIYIAPYSLPVLSYLLSLNNPTITKRLKEKIIALYKDSREDLGQSEEYKQFVKHKKAFPIPKQKLGSSPPDHKKHNR